MTSINNIIYNQTIFSQVNHWVTLLCQLNGETIIISLPNAHLLTFIHPFTDIPACQNHMTRNNNKTFTLFAYGSNVETWLWNNNLIPDQLDEIIVFCPNSNNRDYLKDWLRRYTHKIKDVIICDELDRESLIFGMKYIKKLYSFFKDDQGVLDLLKREYKNIALALINSLANEVNQQDNFIRLGTQPI